MSPTSYQTAPPRTSIIANAIAIVKLQNDLKMALHFQRCDRIGVPWKKSNHSRAVMRLELHAFVLMPEHVHLLLTPAPGVTLERAVQFIKGGYSHAVGVELDRKGEVWQRGFTDHRIRDVGDFDNHLAYIHENPVKRGLVDLAADYRYCSAFPGFKLDGWPSAAEAA